MTAQPVTTADIDTRPPLDLEPIRVHCESATPGPWAADLTDVNTADGRALVLLGDADTRTEHPQATADAEFIAHARTDLPALVAEVERLRARLRGDTPISLCEWCGQPVTVGQSFAYQPGTGGLVEHTACATPGA